MKLLRLSMLTIMLASVLSATVSATQLPTRRQTGSRSAPVADDARMY